MSRNAGTIYFKVGGVLYEAKGAFNTNLGKPKREAQLSTTGVAGYKETQQVPFIEGEIFDAADLDIPAILDITDETITLELATGKVHSLRNAWFAGEGTLNTEEGTLPVRFEGKSAEEVR